MLFHVPGASPLRLRRRNSSFPLAGKAKRGVRRLTILNRKSHWIDATGKQRTHNLTHTLTQMAEVKKKNNEKYHRRRRCCYCCCHFHDPTRFYSFRYVGLLIGLCSMRSLYEWTLCKLAGSDGLKCIVSSPRLIQVFLFLIFQRENERKMKKKTAGSPKFSIFSNGGCFGAFKYRRRSSFS